MSIKKNKLKQNINKNININIRLLSIPRNLSGCGTGKFLHPGPRLRPHTTLYFSRTDRGEPGFLVYKNLKAGSEGYRAQKKSKSSKEEPLEA